MERPTPQPGQLSIPTKLNAHKLICPVENGSINAKYIKAAIHMKASRFFEIKCEIFFVCGFNNIIKLCKNNTAILNASQASDFLDEG